MDTINKKKALERLATLEKETQELRKIIDAPVSIIDRVQSYEDACEVLERNTDLPFPGTNNVSQEAANAFYMLDTISEALLEGKILDWADSDQPKHYPWFNNYTPGSGFRFYDTICGWTSTAASGGARLCVDTDEKAKYFGTHFLTIWNKFLNPIK